MNFEGFCLMQAFRIRQELRAQYQAFLRREMVHDAALERRSRFEVIAGMTFSAEVARDIAEWRVER